MGRGPECRAPRRPWGFSLPIIGRRRSRAPSRSSEPDSAAGFPAAAGCCRWRTGASLMGGGGTHGGAEAVRGGGDEREMGGAGIELASVIVSQSHRRARTVTRRAGPLAGWRGRGAAFRARCLGKA